VKISKVSIQVLDRAAILLVIILFYNHNNIVMYLIVNCEIM